MATKKFAMIAACCQNNGIGIKNRLPWRLKNELLYFTRTTTQTKEPGKTNAVIMGRKTFESIPAKYRPLPDRLNVVISKSLTEKPAGADYVFDSFDEALKQLSKLDTVEKLFVIGGEMLYRVGINHEACGAIYLTRIEKDFECDTFFPDVDPNVFKPESHDDVPQDNQEENGIQYKYLYYVRA